MSNNVHKRSHACEDTYMDTHKHACIHSHINTCMERSYRVQNTWNLGCQNKVSLNTLSSTKSGLAVQPFCFPLQTGFCGHKQPNLKPFDVMFTDDYFN